MLSRLKKVVRSVPVKAVLIGTPMAVAITYLLVALSSPEKITDFPADVSGQANSARGPASISVSQSSEPVGVQEQSSGGSGPTALGLVRTQMNRDDFKLSDLGPIESSLERHLAPLKNNKTQLAYYGLVLAERVEKNENLRPLQDAFLRYLVENPEEALQLAKAGLEALPLTADYSVERNGLLMTAVFTSSPEQVRPLAESELTSFQALARPPVREEMSEDQLVQALSSGHDHEHLRQAFTIWTNSSADRPDLDGVVTFMRANDDLLLRRHYYSVFRARHANLEDQLDQNISRAGLPLSEIKVRPPRRE